MDKLDVLREFEKQGGADRKQHLYDLMVAARKLGCNLEIGGGRKGGINLRYGSIGFAVLDVNSAGTVKLYVQPHPNGQAIEELRGRLNGFIEQNEHLEPTSFPINTYGHLNTPLEEIPIADIIGYINESVSTIKEFYYS